MTIRCNVCEETLGEPIYRSGTSNSLTSLCQILDGETVVYCCKSCGHTQTAEIENSVEFYNTDYKILVENEDEDQLYKIENGRKIYRLEHQADTVLEKVDLPAGACVLDYGAAKGASLKTLSEHRPDIHPHFFDVSQMYVPFWEKLVDETQWACYQTKAEWKAKFDLITSFFVVEHVAELNELIETVAGLMKPGGTFFFTVPSMFANIADFIVADHVNHFSPQSIIALLNRHGFCDIEVDSHSHESAFVVTAKLPETEFVKVRLSDSDPGIAATIRSVNEMADYWTQVAGSIETFESQLENDEPVAIYGSGFYGSYIATCLKSLERVVCFLDANPHQQGKELFGKPILAPENMPESIQSIFVGLNPRIAHDAIANVPGWAEQNLRYYFMPSVQQSFEQVAA